MKINPDSEMKEETAAAGNDRAGSPRILVYLDRLIEDWELGFCRVDVMVQVT